METIKVNFFKELIIRKVWNGTAWVYAVKKYSLWLGLSIPGWSDEPGIYMKVKQFPTIEEAREYALMIKNNYLAGK
jgi:hypothetical protein